MADYMALLLVKTSKKFKCNSLESLFTPTKKTTRTTDAEMVNIPRCKHEYISKQTYSRIGKLYNQLPLETRVGKIKPFKKALKEFLTSKK